MELNMREKPDSVRMGDFERWKRITRGIYRFVIAAKVCYEIHVFDWTLDTDIMSANSKLYIVGEWRKDRKSVFERELLFSGPLSACIQAAIDDNEENNQ